MVHPVQHSIMKELDAELCSAIDKAKKRGAIQGLLYALLQSHAHMQLKEMTD